MNSKLNVLNLTAVLFLGMLVLAGCAVAPKPPATALDNQTMEKFQGVWQSLPESNGNVLTLKVIGQKVSVFATLTKTQNAAHTTRRNAAHTTRRNAYNTYNGFETAYEINDGVVTFRGRTNLLMKFWFKEDGVLVGTREKHPKRLIVFQYIGKIANE